VPRHRIAAGEQAKTKKGRHQAKPPCPSHRAFANHLLHPAGDKS